MQPFLTLPDARRYVLRNAAWLGATTSSPGGDDVRRGDIIISNGRIETIGADVAIERFVDDRRQFAGRAEGPPNGESRAGSIRSCQG